MTNAVTSNAGTSNAGTSNAGTSNAGTSNARLSAGATPPTPDAARTTWPRMALLGLVLAALGAVALLWNGGGDRLLLGGLGALAAVRGSDLLRGGRAGRLPRAAAASGALAAWLGLVAVAVALVSGTATAWVLTAALVLALPALALGGRRSTPALAGAAVVVVGAVLLGVLGGTDALRTVGTAAVAVAVTALGLANLLGAIGMRRIAGRPARRPAAVVAAPAAPAGVAHCADPSPRAGRSAPSRSVTATCSSRRRPSVEAGARTSRPGH